VRDFPEFSEYLMEWDFEILLFLFPLMEELESTLGTNNPLYLFAFPLSTSGNQNVLDLAAYAEAAQTRMLARVAADPTAYHDTHWDEVLAADLARIRAWPAEDNF
jgi:spore maturation protein CgeB